MLKAEKGVCCSDFKNTIFTWCFVLFCLEKIRGKGRKNSLLRWMKSVNIHYEIKKLLPGTLSWRIISKRNLPCLLHFLRRSSSTFFFCFCFCFFFFFQPPSNPFSRCESHGTDGTGMEEWGCTRWRWVWCVWGGKAHRIDAPHLRLLRWDVFAWPEVGAGVASLLHSSSLACLLVFFLILHNNFFFLLSIPQPPLHNPPRTSSTSSLLI